MEPSLELWSVEQSTNSWESIHPWFLEGSARRHRGSRFSRSRECRHHLRLGRHTFADHVRPSSQVARAQARGVRLLGLQRPMLQVTQELDLVLPFASSSAASHPRHSLHPLHLLNSLQMVNHLRLLHHLHPPTSPRSLPKESMR